jgi:glycosyltransferase involved in cell wall biosynthesis
MLKTPNISVIIPSNHSQQNLLDVLSALCCQTQMPTEIIIIDSSGNGTLQVTEIKDLCSINNVKLIYEHRNHAFPGEARNIGLSLARGDFIAFIDVQTIPRSYWLHDSIKLLNNNIHGVFGYTEFSAVTKFETLVRDAFFGVLPRRTLPGSVFKKNVFVNTGRFIDLTRAGEDTEWMLRVDVLKIPVAYPLFGLVDYVGLIGMDLKTMLKKWHRNYSASHYLPHLFPQKLFLWMVLYPLIIFVGFNWNYLFANWHEDSPLYIAHITKMVAILPIFAYVITRGILLPLRRGVGSNQLFPIRFLQIAGICLMADAVKAFVFSIPKFKH